MQSLSAELEKLRDELRIKDRLISKLLGGSDEDTSYVDVTDQASVNPSPKSALMKLKTELDLAYKVLSARDVEINTMKK